MTIARLMGNYYKELSDRADAEQGQANDLTARADGLEQQLALRTEKLTLQPGDILFVSIPDASPVEYGHLVDWITKVMPTDVQMYISQTPIEVMVIRKENNHHDLD